VKVWAKVNEENTSHAMSIGGGFRNLLLLLVSVSNKCLFTSNAPRGAACFEETISICWAGSPLR
jgi:hypothetical protein